MYVVKLKGGRGTDRNKLQCHRARGNRARAQRMAAPFSPDHELYSQVQVIDGKNLFHVTSYYGRTLLSNCPTEHGNISPWKICSHHLCDENHGREDDDKHRSYVSD